MLNCVIESVEPLKAGVLARFEIGFSLNREGYFMERGAVTSAAGSKIEKLSMEDTTTAAVEADFIQAILEGGPVTIPASSRVQEVSPFDEKVKLLHYRGHEHFERVGSLVGDTSGRRIIYRWPMRTELAE